MNLKEPLLSDQETPTAGESQPKGSPQEHTLKLCMMFGCSAVYAARSVIPLVVPEVAKEFDWSSILVGYVLSFFFWGYALTQVVGGRLADRVGGARVMVATSAVGAASLLLFPALVPLWPPAAVLLRCLLGLVQGPHYPSLSVVTTQLVPAPRRARFLSMALLGSPLGTVLIGLLGSTLLLRLGWRAVVLLTGAVYASAALWMQRVTRHCRAQARASTTPGSAAVPWCALLRSRPVWVCIFVHMTHTTVWFLLISWLPSYFKQVHPQAQGWLVNTLPFAVNATGTLLSAPLFEWLAGRQLGVTAVRKLIEVPSQLISAAALCVLPAVSSSVSAVILMCVAAGLIGMHANGGLMLPQDLCPQHVGSLFGLMNTGGALAGFLTNLLAGYLLEAFGSYGPMFHMAGALAVAGGLTFTVLGSAERLQL